VVFRDPIKKENLWWTCAKTETTSVYLQGRETLESLGYTILSVTGDGFGGIRSAFVGIPFQMCHVHMERLVIKGTTRRPLTLAGQVLLALVQTLHQGTDSTRFSHYLRQYVEKFRSFLNERTTNPLTGEWSYTHERVRQATFSLVRFELFLFTFEKDQNIPRTTNSLEGHFSHVRDIVGIHRGMSRPHMERVLHSIFLASTIAPDMKRLEEVL
jgi:hypothetical protein